MISVTIRFQSKFTAGCKYFLALWQETKLTEVPLCSICFCSYQVAPARTIEDAMEWCFWGTQKWSVVELILQNERGCSRWGLFAYHLCKHQSMRFQDLPDLLWSAVHPIQSQDLALGYRNTRVEVRRYGFKSWLSSLWLHVLKKTHTPLQLHFHIYWSNTAYPIGFQKDLEMTLLKHQSTPGTVRQSIIIATSRE